MKRKLSFAYTLCFMALLNLWYITAAAQVPPSNLSGEDLKSWFRTNYYDGKHNTLGYTNARIYMYNYIDNYNNIITCVYSGYQKSWTYGGTGTNPTPINCEHTVPQSFFGEDEPMRSDIHHLFPSYENWNSIRSNYPFDEIPDAQTTKWMYLSNYITTIPTSNIDLYSEYYSYTFEPREDHKGNVARAIFYFFTMYPTQAGNINSVADPELLYQWHLADPVDTREIARNDKIETYQGNRNPYIDYPETVALAWGFSEPTPDYCTSLGRDADGEWISEVQIGSFIHTSGSASYSDFTGITCNLYTGTTSISLTPDFSGTTYSEYWKIWIDLNADGDFDDSGENVFNQGTTSKTTVNGSLYIPDGYELTTRMRITMKYNGEPSACETFSYGEVEDYTVTISSAAVLPPLADFTSNTTNIAEGGNVTFTDLSTQNPTSWNWNFTGGSPSTSSLQNPTITYNTAGTYPVSLTVSNSGGSDSEIKTGYITVTPSTVTYCATQGNNYNYEYIAKVQIGNFTNTSSGSKYSDFSNLIVPVSIGSNSISLTPEFPNSTYTEYWRVWIDFNKDGDFTDSGEEVFAPSASSSVVNGTITIPSDFSEQTRMRITMKYGGSPTPCETFSYGEVEDYTISTSSIKSAYDLTENTSEIKTLFIYPSPAKDFIQIRLSDNSLMSGTADISDLQGKSIKSFILENELNTLDISDISTGLYIVKIVTGGNSYVRQIIIE